MCMPREPEVLGKPRRPCSSSTSRTPRATSRTSRERHLGPGVEVDAQLVGVVEVVAADRPGVPVDHPEVHAPDEVGGVVGHQLARGAAAGEGDGRGLDPLRRRAGHALLEERLALHPVDPALHHRRALAQVTDDRRRALDVVVDEVELGEAALGEEGLGGTADAQLAPAAPPERHAPCRRPWLKGCPIVSAVHALPSSSDRRPVWCEDMLIPDTLLIAVCAFGAALPAERVAQALAKGVRAGGMREPDVCPIEDEPPAGFDVRMRRARAVIVGAERLDRETLATDGDGRRSVRDRHARASGGRAGLCGDRRERAGRVRRADPRPAGHPRGPHGHGLAAAGTKLAQLA